MLATEGMTADMATVRFVRQTSPGKYLEKQGPGHWPPVHLEVHSSSIMSVLQSHPGSFLLLVKNLLEYQDYAPNGSIYGSKWNMFNHVHTGSGFIQVQVFFLSVAEFLQLALTLEVFGVP